MSGKSKSDVRAGQPGQASDGREWKVPGALPREERSVGGSEGFVARLGKQNAASGGFGPQVRADEVDDRHELPGAESVGMPKRVGKRTTIIL